VADLAALNTTTKMTMQTQTQTKTTVPGTDPGAKPLRILMVLESEFTQRGGGGAESQLRTLATHMRRMGQQVSIVAPLLWYGPQVPVERCFGIPVGRVSYPRVPVLGAAIMCLKFGKFLLGHGRRYDAWHIHIGHHLGAVTCLVGSVIGKPVVLKISGWWELEKGVMAPRLRPFDMLAKRWLTKAGTVQAISTRIAAELVKQGFPPERILVLPNAVDTSRFRVRTAQRAAGEPFTAVFVGRLVPEKGLDTLLDAWAGAFRGRADVQLKLVGGGPIEKDVRAQAERLGIVDQVQLLGHRDDIEAILAGADVGLLTSRIEGLSNTLLEFMASGLPAIASQVSGSEDFVKTGRNGWLFPVDDRAALASCLREAAAAPPARLAEMGRHARADVEAASSLDRVVGTLMKLYRGAHPRDVGEKNGAIGKDA
jgi:glycosyltransferase involved in cell wall biosynthesis